MRKSVNLFNNNGEKRPQKSFFASKPTHSQQIRQLVAENTMLKQRLLSANQEQRSLDYWKSIVTVVTAELQSFDQSSIKEDTPFADVIEAVAKNIITKLAEHEKKMETTLKENLTQEKQEASNNDADKEAI